MLPIRKKVRNAFAKATCVCRTPVQNIYRDMLSSISKKARVLDLGLPFMHLPSYNQDNKTAYIQQSSLYNDVKQIRDEHDIVILYHSRQIWKNILSTKSNKGTDILYKGLALFHESKPDVKIKLVAFEYGHDVPASKELIKQLGIKHLIH